MTKATTTVDYNFFKEIWGFEETLDNVRNLINCTKNKDDNIIVESLLNGRKVQAGKFEVRMVKQFPLYPAKLGATFNIVIGNGNWTHNLKKIDVGALQANPQNRGATFQVASNFNCLEFISNKDNASKGITKYVNDQTQGPAASISAAPGTLYRNYFVKHNDDDGNQHEGQIKQQINLLDKFPYIPVINGYVSFKDEEIKFIEDFEFNDISEIKVGIQKNVQATSGEKRNGMIEMCTDQKQIINQVFTAAMNLGGVSATYAERPIAQKLARFLLRGAYRATILSAIENSRTQPPECIGKDKLFLTLIGGGVFGNQYEWITDAILECTDLIKTSGLQIYLVIYSSYCIDDTSLCRLGHLVAETKGNQDIVG